MEKFSALDTLVTLLQSGRAQPRVEPSRLAPSTIYDLHYRMAVIASTFEIHAVPYLLGQRRIAASRLKLLQFVAIRPWLVPVIRKWSETQGYAQQSTLSPQQLRRGFLGDETHDAVVAFLVARGVLHRIHAHLGSSANSDLLTRLYSTALENTLFSTSLQALRDLTDIRITNSMLEGW
jgi:hypothetical protein